MPVMSASIEPACRVDVRAGRELPNPGVQPRAQRVGCNDVLGGAVLFVRTCRNRSWEQRRGGAPRSATIRWWRLP